MRSNPLLPSPTIPANPKSIAATPPPAGAAAGAARRRREFAVPARAIIAPEPPWLVPHRPIGRIPISLRLVQLQKKSLARRQRPENPSSLCPVGGAVWSLICLVEDLHKSTIYVADEGDRDKIFWDSAEPLIWLFLRVFSNSPNLLSAILDLTASFVVRSVERCVVETVSSAFDLEKGSAALASEVGGEGIVSAESSAIVAVGESLQIGMYWGGVGFSEKGELDSCRRDLRRRRSYYESMIVREKKPNSLILSNYAQFLYQFEGDIERAQEYFKLALMAEPADGEAFNKYAKFLWRARGDFAGAEEMFLEAIEMDSTNSYHQSSYANFLFLTGGDETCFPLDHGGPVNGS